MQRTNYGFPVDGTTIKVFMYLLGFFGGLVFAFHLAARGVEGWGLVMKAVMLASVGVPMLGGTLTVLFFSIPEADPGETRKALASSFLGWTLLALSSFLLTLFVSFAVEAL